MDVLRRFYRDVRPIGFWGPVEAELPPEERKSIRKRARTELVACGWGVACYFLMVMALFAVMGRHFPIAAGSSVLAAVMGVTFIRALARPGNGALRENA